MNTFDLIYEHFDLATLIVCNDTIMARLLALNRQESPGAREMTHGEGGDAKTSKNRVAYRR